MANKFEPVRRFGTTWFGRLEFFHCKSTEIDKLAQNTFFHINFDKNSTFHERKNELFTRAAKTNDFSRERAKRTIFHVSEQNERFFTSERTIGHS